MIAVLTLIGICLGFGLIIGFADKIFYVKPDERLATIKRMLPGVDWGACGFPGCMGLAMAIVEQEGKVSACRPIKQEQKEELWTYLENYVGENGEKFDMRKVK